MFRATGPCPTEMESTTMRSTTSVLRRTRRKTNPTRGFRAVASVAAIVLVTSVTSGPAGAANPAANQNTSKKLRQALSAAGMSDHLQALQSIANANNGTRVSGTNGFDASAAYAVGVLTAAGLQVSTQAFQFQTFINIAPAQLTQIAPGPATVIPTSIFAYSGSGAVTAPVSSPSLLGCFPGDYAGFPAGNIALVSRGACTFATKATNAYNAGASAVVIYNNAAGIINGTLGAAFTLNIGVTAVTQAVGQQLVGTAGLVLRVTTQTFRGLATTHNVIAETTGGDPDNVVMIGAHLDSVNAGPGINDNGTGSALVLELAEQMAKVKTTNRVRFVLWGAEESGLIGSRFYVAGLSPENLQKIALYLNFDMIGSPNYARFVYDGNGSAFGLVGPTGSDAIEQLFHDYFAGEGLASGQTAFSGRSDYQAFILNGIPSGGLFTGAEGVKTAAEAAAFGGTAGVAYDACYHQACDTFANVNQQAIEEMGDAAAHVLLTYAFDTGAVNGSSKGHPVSPPGQNTTGVPAGAATLSGGGLHEDDHRPEAA